jgi:predicted TIM-barrel fold metal-dependent hydrolase
MIRPLPVSLPFDPNPRPPRVRLPPGACDTHFHIFGPPNVFPFAATRRYEPPAAPYEYYRAMQRATGLERGVVVQPSAHGLDHAALLDAIARSGGTLKGVVNMSTATSDAELDGLKARGVVGARFSLMSDRPGDRAAIEAAIPRLSRLGWSLDLHIEAAHLLAHADFIRALPLTTVIDHMGRPEPSRGLDQPAFRLVLDLASDPRFWIKVSALDKLSDQPHANPPDGLPFKDTIPFARAVIAAAPDRVVWGSDWPHGNTFEPGTVPNDGALLDLLMEIVPDAARLRRILVDNPARLYGFA